jgi:hypothetical protein
MTVTEIVVPALFYGAIISLIMTAMIFITFRWNPEMWVHDAPPKIRDRYGPVGDKAKRDGRFAAIPIFLLLGGVLVYAVVDLHRRAGGPPGFWPIFLTFFVAMQTFNLFDLLVIDWLIVATLKPRALLIPGTETWEGYGDYGFYFTGFLKGLVGITVASAVLAGVAALIGWVVAR